MRKVGVSLSYTQQNRYAMATLTSRGIRNTRKATRVLIFKSELAGTRYSVSPSLRILIQSCWLESPFLRSLVRNWPSVSENGQSAIIQPL